MSIANIILGQLGGRRFIAMTGARNLLDGGTYLSFKLPAKPGFVREGLTT